MGREGGGEGGGEGAGRLPYRPASPWRVKQQLFVQGNVADPRGRQIKDSKQEDQSPNTLKGGPAVNPVQAV